MSSTFADSILKENGSKWTFESITAERNKQSEYLAQVDPLRGDAKSINERDRIHRADIWIRNHALVLSRAHTALLNANRQVADILPLEKLYRKALALAKKEENIPALAKLDVEKLAIAFEHARTVEYDLKGVPTYGTTPEDAAAIARATSDDGSWFAYVLQAAADNFLAPYISTEKLPPPFYVHEKIKEAKQNILLAIKRLDREFAAIKPFEAIFASEDTSENIAADEDGTDIAEDTSENTSDVNIPNGSQFSSANIAETL